MRTIGALMPLAVASLALAGCGGSKGAESAAADSATRARADSAAKAASQKFGISTVMIGKRLGMENRMAEPTFQFGPNDTVYLSVGTEGTTPEAKIATKWVSPKRQVVDSSSRSIQPKGPEFTEFHVPPPAKGWPVGVYAVTVYLEGDSVDAKTFAVKK
jgi:hypothetical protein